MRSRLNWIKAAPGVVPPGPPFPPRPMIVPLLVITISEPPGKVPVSSAAVAVELDPT